MQFKQKRLCSGLGIYKGCADSDCNFSFFCIIVGVRNVSFDLKAGEPLASSNQSCKKSSRYGETRG